MARLQPHLGLLPPDVEVKMAEVNEVKEVDEVAEMSATSTRKEEEEAVRLLPVCLLFYFITIVMIGVDDTSDASQWLSLVLSPLS